MSRGSALDGNGRPFEQSLSLCLDGIPEEKKYACLFEDYNGPSKDCNGPSEYRADLLEYCDGLFEHCDGPSEDCNGPIRRLRRSNQVL
jgi:hypothetical protein